ncbi:hypothetical protein Q7P36_008185 [Cladosporium allicinum]
MTLASCWPWVVSSKVLASHGAREDLRQKKSEHYVDYPASGTTADLTALLASRLIASPVLHRAARTRFERRRQATNVAQSDVAAADSPGPSRLKLQLTAVPAPPHSISHFSLC